MKKECNKCHEEKELSEFYKDKNSPGGYQRACKNCMNIAYNISRAKKKEHYNSLQETRRKKNGMLFNKWKEEQGCSFCDEDYGPCLELHHHEDNKDYNVSDLSSYSFKKMITEAEKCIIVCANCHRKIHYGKINIGV